MALDTYSWVLGPVGFIPDLRTWFSKPVAGVGHASQGLKTEAVISK